MTAGAGPSAGPWARLQEALQVLNERLQGRERPRVGLVMGSGLADALGPLDEELRVPWAEVPHLPPPTIAGHAGELVFGWIGKTPVLLQRGRLHFYEGHAMEQVVFPVRLQRLLGVSCLILTNAAGAINRRLRVGDFVLIRDHINGLPDTPLRGPNVEELGPRFPSMVDAYSPRLRRLAHRIARRLGLRLREGIYVAAPGPMYETPAEIQAYKRLGADLVGMSTVPEVIVARHCGLEVLAISVVTNLAAGLGRMAPTHEEVLETTKRRERALARLLRALVAAL